MGLRVQIAKNVKLAREAQGLTQVQVAARAGVKSQSVSKLEKDGSGSIEMLERMAVALNLSLTALVCHDESPPVSILESRLRDLEAAIKDIRLALKRLDKS